MTSFPPLKFNLSEFLRIHKMRDGLESLMYTLLGLPVMLVALNAGWFASVDMSEATSWLKLISRISGLYATQLILIQLIVISRNSMLNYLYGHDKLTAFHKKLGKPAYILMVVHFVAATYEYVITQNKSFLQEIVAYFEYPDFGYAIIGFVIFTWVVFTSLNIFRKHIPYEIWYFTHFLAYLAVILSFPHQVTYGTDFKDSWLATGYWWGLYIVSLSFIAIWRFAIPLWISLRHQFYVDRIERETSNVVSVYVKGRRLDKLEQYAGQFYMWRFLTPRLFLQSHPFSISTAPNKDYLRVTIAALGDGSKTLQNIKVGTKLMLDGPYGIFTENRRLFKHVTLIAAGIGITPVRSLVEEFIADKGDLTVIYRGDDEVNMPFIDELKEFETSKGIDLHLSVGKRGFANSWLSGADSTNNDKEALLRIAPNVVVSDVYVCGPVAWAKSVKKSLLDAGVSKEQIHIEEFGW
jgi:predicted ferric reductase